MIDIRFLSLFLLNHKNLNIDIFITSFRIIYLTKTMTTDLTNKSFDYTITRNNPDLDCHKLNLWWGYKILSS